jgi:hypothetical protein
MFYKGRPFQQNGWISVSSEPGFGVELDLDRMQWYQTQYPISLPQRGATSRRPQQSGVVLHSTKKV